MAHMLIVVILSILSLGGAVAEAGALDRPQRNAPTGTKVDSLNTSSLPYIEILRGRDGRDGRDGVPGPRGPQGERGEAGAPGPQGPRGLQGQRGEAGGPQCPRGPQGQRGASGAPGTQGSPGSQGERGEAGATGPQGPSGPQGEKGEAGAIGPQGSPGLQGEKGDAGATGPQGLPGPRSGGVVYTRWGKTSCPNVSGTELVYAGRAGGTLHTDRGGAANYLCMPNDPDYLRYQSGVQGYSSVYGVEYELNSGQPLSAVFEHNVPCAVCHASTRVAVTMIPAKTRCPSTWTLEYSGYLMSEASRYSHHSRTMFECIDKNPDTVPGGSSRTDPAFIFHVEANCNGMACPPYDPQKELTCAVCTK